MYSIWVNGENYSDIIQNWSENELALCTMCVLGSFTVSCLNAMYISCNCQLYTEMLLFFYPYRFVFWSDWGSEHKIERARFDGSQRSIVISINIKWPNGLSLDRQAQRLYWVDGSPDFRSIQSIDYYGAYQRQVVSSESGNLYFAFGMAFFNGFVFWSDWSHFSVFSARVNDDTGSLNEMLIQHFLGVRPMQPIVVSTSYPREGGMYTVHNMLLEGEIESNKHNNML